LISDKKAYENPEMTIPDKKRIITELIIGKLVAFFLSASRIRDELHKGDQPVVLAGLRVKYIPWGEKVYGCEGD